MKTITTLLALLVCAAAAPAGVEGQTEDRALQWGSRQVADSTYAVRVELDRIAEQMRQGELSARERPDAELAGSVRALAAAAQNRRTARPHPSLGPVWDLQLEAVEVTAAGPDQLRVRARIYLATLPAEPETATLVFRKRDDGQWNLVNHQGLAGILSRLQNRLAEAR